MILNMKNVNDCNTVKNKKRYIGCPAQGIPLDLHPVTGIPQNKCFLNLVRLTITAMLANHGFLIREVLVNKEENIALVLTLPEDSLKREADRLNLNKKVDFGMADLMSLEPVDSKGRPLRLNECIYDERAWNSKYRGKEEKGAENLRGIILDLITNHCNMKKVVRLANAKWMEGSSSQFSDIYSHSEVSLSEWEKYRNYLVNLAVHVKSIESLEKKTRFVQQAYYGESRIVKRGNLSRSYLDDVELSKLVNRLVLRAMKKCIEDAKLKTIWDLIQKPPLDYAFEYACPNSHMKPITKRFYDLVWADYCFHLPHHEEEFETKRKFLMEMTESPADKHNDEDPTEELEMYHYQFSKSERLKIVNTMVVYCNPDSKHIEH